MDAKTVHIPVMRDEVIDSLQAAHGGEFIDCTLGGAGHTEAILEAHQKNSVLGVDRDERAIGRAKKRLEKFSERVRFAHSAFGSVESVTGSKTFDGMLIDLGLSTDQLKENRGFSFKDSSALDMRMDESQDLSARTVVNSYSEKDLLSVLHRGGVGKEAKAVVRGIMQARPIETTEALAKVVNRAAAGLTSKTKINPATVIFQAIRMEVNGELAEIESVLNAAPRIVKNGGRLAVITFHSIEDKIVTHTMREWQAGDDKPASWRGPRVPGKGKFLSSKAIVPTDEEISRNPASRSARLRVFEFGG